MRSVFTDVNKLWQSVGTNKTHARLSNRLYQNSQCILVITWHLPSIACTCFIRSYRLLYFNYVGNTRNIIVILADYFLLLETNWRIQCNNGNNLFFSFWGHVISIALEPIEMLSVYSQNVERSERSRLLKHNECFE